MTLFLHIFSFVAKTVGKNANRRKRVAGGVDPYEHDLCVHPSVEADAPGGPHKAFIVSNALVDGVSCLPAAVLSCSAKKVPKEAAGEGLS